MKGQTFSIFVQATSGKLFTAGFETTPFDRDSVAAKFAPAVISILEDAFDDAWRRVQASKAPSSAKEYAPAAQMILAKYIIKAAQTGERDPRWLADSALLYLSRQKLSRTPPKNSP
jgi:hypothetical protein